MPFKEVKIILDHTSFPTRDVGNGEAKEIDASLIHRPELVLKTLELFIVCLESIVCSIEEGGGDGGRGVESRNLTCGRYFGCKWRTLHNDKTVKNLG